MTDPEFDGSTSVVDWVERVELTCRLCGVKPVTPLQVTGDALDVYQKLSDNEKAAGLLHSVRTLYYPDINGRRDSGCVFFAAL